MRVSHKLFIWLLIGLVAGQAPLLASAECCHTGKADAQRGMTCCGEVEMSCTASPSGDAPMIAPRADGCPCLERPAELPARAPDPPSEIGKLNFRTDQPDVTTAAPAAGCTSYDSKRYSWPPGTATGALASIRVIVLLI